MLHYLKKRLNGTKNNSHNDLKRIEDFFEDILKRLVIVTEEKGY